MALGLRSDGVRLGMAQLDDIVEPDLKHRTVTGVMWSAGARAVQQFLNFVVTVVIARLLVPEDFGLIAMILVFTGFAMLFVDFGLAAAIVQRKTLDERHLSSAFWMNLGAGLALSGVVAALAPALASIYDEPRLVLLTLVMSSSFLLGSLAIVQSAVLSRAMNFRRLGGIDIGSTLVGGSAAIAAAASGYGVWSLVVQLLVSTLARVALLWALTEWRPRLLFDVHAARELWRFSANLAGFSGVNYWSRNADNFLIGIFVGPAALGIYGRAYNLMLLPLTQVVGVISRVMFPALSRLQDDPERVKRAYLRAIGIIGLITFPLVAGLLVAAEPFVLALLGPKWRDVIPVLQILCVAGLTQSVGATVNWIYQSQGRTDLLFKWGLATSAITLVAFGIGIVWGVYGVAIAYVVRTLGLLYFNYAIPGKLIGMSFGDVVHAMRGVLAAALLMAVTVWAVNALLPDWSPGIVLLIDVVIGVLAYGTLTRLLVGEPYEEVKDLVRDRVGRKAVGSAA